MPLPPEAELQWWYQYYFATERGRAGYDKIPARLRQADLADRLAAVGLRRRHVRAQRGGLRQPRSRRHRDPQLPLAAGPGRRRASVRRAGTAARRGAGDHRADHHPRRRRQRRAAPGPERLRQEVLRQVRAPDSSPAASATTCPRKPRRRSPRPSSMSTACIGGREEAMDQDASGWQTLGTRPTLAARRTRRGPAACRGSRCRVRRRDRVAQLAAADRGRPARQGRPGQLLDLHLHQLAAHPALCPRLGRAVHRTTGWW